MTGSGTSWEANLAFPASGSGTVTVSLAQDSTSPQNAAASASIAYAEAADPLVLAWVIPTEDVGNDFSVTLTSNYPVTGVERSDFRLIQRNPTQFNNLTADNSTIVAVAGTNNWRIDFTLDGTYDNEFEVRLVREMVVVDGVNVPVTANLSSSLFRVDSSVGAEALDFGSETIANQAWVVGTAVNLTLPEAAGGTGTTTYSLSSTLPAGVTFTTGTRVLAGNPTGRFTSATFTYTSTNGTETDTLTFTIVVTAPAISFASTIANQAWVVGTAVILTLPTASGGVGAFAYSLSPTTPSGVSFTASTRVLAGNPTGRFSSANFTYTATDAEGITQTQTFTIVVTATAITFSPASFSNQTWTVGTSVNLTLPAGSGGVGNLTPSLVGTLPSGVTFTASTRALAGNPTAAFSVAAFTYRLTDTEGISASITFMIVVNAAAVVLGFGGQTIANQAWVVGTAVNLTLPQATGGTGTITYSLSPTTPAGVTFTASTRVLAGNPTGRFTSATFTYTATDADGNTDDLTFTIVVTASAITFDSGIANQSWQVGTAVSLTMPTVSGGVGAFVYSLTPALPAGVTFTAGTRLLSGTPTAVAASATYTYTGTDAEGIAASRTFTIVVAAAALVATSIVYISGNNQIDTVSTTLSTPYVVEVRDQNGDALSGITVAFAVTAGGGSLSASSVTTDSSGQAESTLTLGSTTGTNTVTATASGITAPVTFTATATATGTAVASYIHISGFNSRDIRTILPPTAGGEAPVILTYRVSGLDNPEGVAFDGTHLHIADDADDNFRMILPPTVGGEAPIVRSYTVSGVGSPRGVTFDGTHLHISESGSQNIRMILPPTVGGEAPIVRSYTVSGVGNPEGVTFDGTHIHISDYNNQDVQMILPPTVGGEAPIVRAYTVSGVSAVTGMASDGTHIHIADFNDNNFRMILPPTVGGEAPIVYTYTVNGLGSPTGMVFDGAIASQAELTLTTTDTDIRAGEAVDIDIASDIDITGFTASDITVTGGTRGALTGSGTSWTLAVTAGTAGTMTIAIAEDAVSPGNVAVSQDFTVNAETIDALSFDTNTIANQAWIVGTAASLTLPAATGGTGTITYSLSPTLPTGKTFTAITRILAGTPTGRFSSSTFTYTATDGSGDTVELAFTIVVNAAAITFNASIADQSWSVGTSVNLTLPTASGGVGSFTYSLVPTLPAGVTFTAGTRVIAGTPTASVTVDTYTYTATDAEGVTQALTFTVVVAAEEGGMPESLSGITGTGIQIGNATEFGVSERFPRGLATDGATVWLFGGNKGYVLDPATGIATRVQQVTGFNNSESTVRSATYHNNQVLVYGNSQKKIQIFDTSAGTLTNFHSNNLSYAGSESGTPDLWGIASLNGVLHAVDRTADGLYTVSAAGVLTKVGTATQFGISAANPRGFTVYHDMFIAVDVGLGKIFSIDEATGIGTIIGDTNTLPDTGFEALVEFDNNLYGAGSDADAWFRLYDVRWDETIADLEVDEGANGSLDLSTVSDDAASFEFAPTHTGRSWLTIAGTTLTVINAPAVSVDTDFSAVVRGVRDGVNVEKTLTVKVANTSSSVLSFGGETIASQSWVVGSAESLTLPAATGGTGAITYSLSTTLPDGVTFTPGTRVLAGTPTGRFTSATFTYTATDGNGDTVELTFTIVVTATAITFASTIANQSWQVGTAVSLTLPTSSGGVGAFTYSLTPALPAGVTFTAGTRVVAGTPTAAVASATYTYTATDAEGIAASRTFAIVVASADAIIFSGTIAAQAWVVGTAVNVTLPAATGGVGTITYSLSPTTPAGITFVAGTRVLSGTPTGRFTSATFTYTAEDADGTTVDLTFTVVVTATAITFASAITNQSWIVGTAVNLTLPTASGGVGSFTYSLSTGLPSGVTFTAGTRSLAGNPTATLSSTTFTYTATDSEGITHTQTFTIVVTTAAVALGFGTSTIANQAWLVGTAVSQTLPGAIGGTGDKTYTLSPTLPTGATFTASTRVLAGTPSATFASATFTYTAEDEDGTTVELTFAIVVTASAITFASTIAAQAWTVGTSISLTLPAASGGVGTFTYSLSPTTPSGITFTGGSRVLAGNPTGRFTSASFTYTAEDSDGVTRTQTFTIVVTAPAITFSPTSFANQVWTVGTAVNLTLPAGSGGVGTLTASLTGTLPGSVTFVASTRRLAGNPTATFSSASFTYTMTDAESESESLTFTIIVADSFEISITVPAQADSGETADILSTISNPNNNTLTITWKATAGDIADDSAEDTTITIPGTSTIIAVTCTVTTDANETATATAYITVGAPAANIFTPAVRIEIEGVDVTDRRIPRDGLSVGKSLDYPELLTFRSSGISFNLDNENGDFDYNNPSNFFVSNSLPAHGRGAQVLVSIGLSQSELIPVFAGEVSEVVTRLGDTKAQIKARDLSVRSRQKVIENFGIEITRRITDFEDAALDYSALDPIFYIPIWGLPISRNSVSLTVYDSENDAEDDINIVDAIKTEGTLSNQNAEVDYARGLIRFEAPPDDGADTVITAIWKRDYRYKRPDFLVRRVLKNTGIQDTLQITDDTNARFAIEQALLRHPTDAVFSSHGRPYFEKHGITRWAMLDDGGDTPEWWMAHDGRLVKYDEFLDEYSEVSAVPDDTSIEEVPPGGYGEPLPDEDFVLVSAANNAGIARSNNRYYSPVASSGSIVANSATLEGVALPDERITLGTIGSGSTTLKWVLGFDVYDGFLYALLVMGNSSTQIRAYNIATRQEDTSKRITGLPSGSGNTSGAWGIAVTPDYIYSVSRRLSPDVLLVYNHAGTRQTNLEFDVDHLPIQITGVKVTSNYNSFSVPILVVLLVVTGKLLLQPMQVCKLIALALKLKQGGLIQIFFA